MRVGSMRGCCGEERERSIGVDHHRKRVELRWSATVERLPRPENVSRMKAAAPIALSSRAPSVGRAADAPDP